jgi:hypothetical protein
MSCESSNVFTARAVSTLPSRSNASNSSQIALLSTSARSYRACQSACETLADVSRRISTIFSRLSFASASRFCCSCTCRFRVFAASAKPTRITSMNNPACFPSFSRIFATTFAICPSSSAAVARAFH